MQKKLVLMYPNLKWKKNDFQTIWNLNPSILCLLGKVVEEQVDVTIIDAQFYDMTMEEFSSRLMEVQPDYVGISMLTSEYKDVLHMTAAKIKELLPNSKIITGGVHVTMEYQSVIADPNIDFAVRGEGEYVLRDLLKHLNGEGDLPTEGLVYRQDGEVIVTKQTHIPDLSELPMPDYDLINMEDYVKVGARSGPARPPEYPHVRMIVTRGCPVGCSFCQVESISGAKVRTRKPEQVADELEYLKKRYGIKSVLFDDDNVAVKKKFFKGMMKEFIDRKLDLKFLLNNFYIYVMDDELLDLIVEAGCVGINIAIESGNQRVMNDIVFKPLDLSKLPATIKKVQEKGLFVIANFILGFPGETWDEIRDSTRYAETCGADYVRFFVAMPLTNTRMHQMAYDLDMLEVSEEDLEINWRFSQIKSNEWTSEDISILRAYEWDRINFGTSERREKQRRLWGMEDAELADMRKRTRDAVSQGLATGNMIMDA